MTQSLLLILASGVIFLAPGRPMASINGLLEKPQPTAMENMGFPWGKPPTAEQSEHRRKSPSFSSEPNLAKAQAKTEICHGNIRNQAIGDPKHQNLRRRVQY